MDVANLLDSLHFFLCEEARPGRSLWRSEVIILGNSIDGHLVNAKFIGDIKSRSPLFFLWFILHGLHAPIIVKSIDHCKCGTKNDSKR